jgi:hypothetical protein
MKGVILYSGWWWRWIPPAYNGMALFPFILFRFKGMSDRMIRHEQIHLRQQLELLILPFYIWYLLEYFIQRIKGKNHHQAYMGISFEREAYKHDSDSVYLKARSFWAHLKYL